MKLKFQGLNIKSNSIEEFFIDNNNINAENANNLANYYLTIDSIYFLSDEKSDSKRKMIFIYDYQKKQFIKLDNLFDNDLITLLSLSENTTDLWILVRNDNMKTIDLLKYNGNILVDKIKLDINKLNLNEYNNLVLLATDINVYIFDNSKENGVKCIYELKSQTDLSKKDSENEKKLNENALSSLPLNKVLINEKIIQFVKGKEHILMLTEKTRKVYSFGIGLKGQLGHGLIENLFEPIEINFFKDKILKIAAGGWHSAAIDVKGHIFMWGWNSEGQIGIEDSNAFITNPTELIIKNEFTDERVKFRTVSLGTRHSILVDDENNLYAFGWNKYGQIFKESSVKYSLNEDTNIEEPLKCLSFNKITIDVKCSNWFSLILMNKDNI